MYNHELTLVKRGFNFDGLQDVPVILKETTVLCKIKSLTRYEFYQMREAGMRPEIAFVIKSYEYDGEDTVRYNNKTYRVVRQYQESFEELELICERLNERV